MFAKIIPYQLILNCPLNLSLTVRSQVSMAGQKIQRGRKCSIENDMRGMGQHGGMLNGGPLGGLQRHSFDENHENVHPDNQGHNNNNNNNIQQIQNGHMAPKVRRGSVARPAARKVSLLLSLAP